MINYITITCNTEIKENSRQFITHFAVADIKYNILGTPFFEKNVQSIDIQTLTMQFTQFHQTCPNTTKIYNNYRKRLSICFIYIYMITSKEAIHFHQIQEKQYTFQLIIIQNYTSTTLNNKQIFPSIPHTYFSSKFNRTFSFIELLTKTGKEQNTCSSLIQNFTSNIATIPKGNIGYIEIPVTIEKPPYYQVNDVNTLIHSIIHTYHPDLTEPQKPSEYICMDIQQQNYNSIQPHINRIHINDKTFNIPVTPVIQNVQPTSVIKKTFPPLPFTEENQNFIKKFNFQFSDLSDTEYVKLCTILVNNKDCYAKHKNDVGLISTPFRIRFKRRLSTKNTKTYKNSMSIIEKN